MPIIIPNTNPKSDYLHSACMLRLRDVFLPLQQPIVLQQVENGFETHECSLKKSNEKLR